MRKILLLNFLVLLFPFLGTSQNNDATFSVADTISGFNDVVRSIAIQPDGKILIGGNFTSYNGNPSNKIARLNSDGTIDNSFTVGTGFNQAVLTIALQTDGKILVGGELTSYNGSPSNNIARLNTDGTLDESFTIGTGFNSSVASIALQADGNIIVGGYFTSFNGSSVGKIARLNTDGTLDNSFTIGTAFNNQVLSVAVQTDGKILVGGVFTSYNGIPLNYFARLNSDGTLDNSFTIGTGFNSLVQQITPQTDGKILVVGWFSSFNGSSANKIARLNSDGTIDNSFTIGTGFNQNVLSITLQTDGKILVVGDFTEFNGSPANRLARLNTNGTLDNSFAIGVGPNQTVYTVSVQSNGKVLVGGLFTNFNGSSVNRIARLNTDGTPDNSFTIKGFNNAVRSIALQSDGKILVGGIFTTYIGNSVNRIARLNTDGTLDNSFTIGSGFNQAVNRIALQTDGKILAGGSFTSYNGNSVNRIARLNTDGTLDNSFTIGSGFNDVIHSIAVQADGKILVGGEFTSYNGIPVNYFARLNSDGTLDNSFTIGTGFGSVVTSIAIQSDGKILVGGQFTSFNGSSAGNIARLNTDGTLDNSLTTGTGFDFQVLSVALQTDGKILIGGMFYNYNGNSANNLARLNSDGTLDNSFTIGTGFNAYVQQVITQTDGKILVGGGFTDYNGNSVNTIAQLNTDGTLDNSFTTGTGFNSSVASIALQSDGKILVGGGFSEFNGIVRNRIARLTNCIASTHVFTHSSCDPYTWIDGIEYTTSNNTATHTIVDGAVNGCDLTVTLNLTITAINTAVTQVNEVLTSQESGAAYQWIDCSDNSPITSATNASFTATSNGSYAVEITKNSCTDTSTCYSITTLGVESFSATSYKLYPNPVTDVFTIESQGNVQRVELYSIIGQLLITITPQSNVIEVDVAPFRSGVYIVKIQNNDGNSTTNRIVKK